MALEYSNRGVGSSLVKESFEIDKKRVTNPFVVGDPACQGRFGFRSSSLFGIRRAPAIPEQYFMAYELSPGALAGVAGTVTFT